MKEIILNENDANQRLDKFIEKFMPKLPKSMLYKGLRKNCVKINGKHIKDGSVKLNEGDILNLYFKDEFFENEKQIKLTEKELEIVYEDENILLINKEAGTVVHSDDKGTEITLIDMIKSYLYKKGSFNPADEHSFSPSLCNRLDQNTSGIIIAAKNAKTLRIINEKIKSREIRKFYLCIADGSTDDKGEINGFLTRHEKKVSVNDNYTKDSKPVKIKYKTLAKKDNSSLVEVELLTGRTHQIRAQFSHIGHPLSGDKKYGSKLKGKYQSLVSYKLIFDFKTDADILNYLTHKEFKINVDFAEKYLSN